MILATRRVASGAVVAALAAAVGALAFPSATYAEPSQPCTGAIRGQMVTDVHSYQVNPRLTHFTEVNIEPGTSLTRTVTVGKIRTVTTTYNGSAEIGAAAGDLFDKLSGKLGFSVQRVTSNTDSETTTTTWQFTEPGRYGAYMGTREVAGDFAQFQCVTKSSTSTTGFWIRTPPFNSIPYTTYAHMEIGTIRCGFPDPPGTVRELAHLELGC